MAYVPKKKTNIYFRKSDNTWYYDKTIKGNRFCAFGYKTQKEAEDALITNLNYFKKTNNIDLSFENLINLYEKFLIQVTAHSTAYNKMKLIKKYIFPFFKKFRIKEINSSALLTWKDVIISKYSKTISKTHLNKIISVARDLFKFIVERYKIDTGYSILLSIKNDDVKNDDIIWDVDTFNKFLLVVDNYKYLVFFHLLFYYGLRLGEAVGLRNDCINFKAKQIKILTQVVNDRYEHKAVDSKPKTHDSIRKFYVDDFTLDLLKRIYNKKNKYLFGSKEKPLSRTTIRRYFNKYIEISGVPKIKIHSLRKSCSTRLYNLDADVKAIGKLLGHSEETMTMYYIQSKKENDLKLLQKLENSIQKDNKIYINLHSKK